MNIGELASLIEALPDVTFGSPFPALETFVGRDLSITNTMNDLNLPFGNDAFDISVTDSHNTVDSHDVAVSDILDVNAGNGVAA